MLVRVNPLRSLFDRRPFIGMVHVPALPGTPRSDGRAVRELAAHAVADARQLAEAGFEALIIENMHDTPYLRRDVGPEIVAAMTAIGLAVRDAVDVPIGVQVLAGANDAALAVAHAIGGSFIRAEGFIFASIADEGLLEKADAGPLLRYRRAIGAEHIGILADIKKKHSSHALTADLDLGETALAAAFFGADAVVVTGSHTGEPTPPNDLTSARKGGLPVVVGSGATPRNVGAMIDHADAVIVGSTLKQDGVWSNPIDAERVKKFLESAHEARG